MIIHANMLDALPLIPRDSVDSVVTDPPYHLASIVKRFGAEGAAPAKVGATGAFNRASRGFMGQEWDGGDVAFDPATWQAVMRVMKPGAHLVAFAHSTNYHKMAIAIEAAGFEIRDQIMWLYGSGFPKSHKVTETMGTALKPAHEPIVLARKPLDESSIIRNVLEWGTGGIEIEGCRIGEGIIDLDPEYTANNKNKVYGNGMGGGGDKNSTIRARHPANVLHTGAIDHEPWRKYFYHAKADHTDRVKRCKPCGSRYSGKSTICLSCGVMFEGGHPTVKPLDLMRYLCRLVTPAGGTILDPFAGTGSTMLAARDEGFKGIGIEMSREYYLDMKWRLDGGNNMDNNG